MSVEREGISIYLSPEMSCVLGRQYCSLAEMLGYLWAHLQTHVSCMGSQWGLYS